MKKGRLLLLQMMAFILVVVLTIIAYGGNDEPAVTSLSHEVDSLAVRGFDSYSVLNSDFRLLEDRIAVVSREEGSGARSVFEELVGINISMDNVVTEDAIIQNGNGVVATFVTNSSAAIGYISFATFMDSGGDLIGLSIDGVAPTSKNMGSGDYPLVRPFNFVYLPANIGVVEEAFIAFAASSRGVEILASLGAIADVDEAVDFDRNAWNLPAVTVAFGGSTSTEATAMELIEEFMEMFPQVEITYEAVGSGAGIIGARDGIFSLGFASRVIYKSELDSGLSVVTYCVDGIVIVVNSANEIRGVTIDQVRRIYLGEIIDWRALRLEVG